MRFGEKDGVDMGMAWGMGCSSEEWGWGCAWMGLWGRRRGVSME